VTVVTQVEPFIPYKFSEVRVGPAQNSTDMHWLTPAMTRTEPTGLEALGRRRPLGGELI
jgi:hypothetical protein